MIDSDRALTAEALSFQSSMLSYLGVLSNIADGRKPWEEIVVHYYDLPIDIVPEAKMRYDLEQLKSSVEFKKATRMLAWSKEEYHEIALGLGE